MSDYYENEEGVWINVHTDKNGKDHIDFYSNNPSEEHTSIHVNWDSSTGNGKIADTTSGSKDTTDTSCYLTSACMKYLQNNFNDDCHELNVLRWFRDNFISDAEKEHYYKTAPIIVESININFEKSLLYNDIYENLVSPCVFAIEHGNYEYAYNKYKNTTLELEEKYARPLLGKRMIKTLKNIKK